MDAIEKLPGDLRLIAEVIGLEDALLLAKKFGGSWLRIPKCEGLRREIRNNQIREDYNSGKYTVRQLCWKYELSDRQVSDILGKTGEDVPPPLLALMQP